MPTKTPAFPSFPPYVSCCFHLLFPSLICLCLSLSPPYSPLPMPMPPSKTWCCDMHFCRTSLSLSLSLYASFSFSHLIFAHSYLPHISSFAFLCTHTLPPSLWALFGAVFAWDWNGWNDDVLRGVTQVFETKQDKATGRRNRRRKRTKRRQGRDGTGGLGHGGSSFSLPTVPCLAPPILLGILPLLPCVPNPWDMGSSTMSHLPSTTTYHHLLHLSTLSSLLTPTHLLPSSVSLPTTPSPASSPTALHCRVGTFPLLFLLLLLFLYLLLAVYHSWQKEKKKTYHHPSAFLPSLSPPSAFYLLLFLQSWAVTACGRCFGWMDIVCGGNRHD